MIHILTAQTTLWEGKHGSLILKQGLPRSELRLKLLVKISTKTGFGSRPVPIFSGGCRERNFKQTIPAVKVEDGEEITYETATTSLRRAVHFFSALQASDGHWPAEIAGPLYCLQPLVMCTYITGHLNSASQQNIGRRSSVLSYVCMRILGEGPDGGEDNACARARKWILDRGGATHIPSWGKTWLSIFGVYEWSGTNPMPPEFWILPSFLPVHPTKVWCYFRTVYMPMSYLYGKKFVAPITPLTLQLREELYCQPYNQINWSRVRHACAKVLCMLACWVKDPNGDYFKKHVARIPDYLWVAEDGMKMQTFGRQEWDTSLAIQALLSSDLADEIGPVLKRGHEFIKASHGSWTFSIRDHRWQVSDCTAEGSKCCLLFSMMPPEIVGEKMEPKRFYDSVDLLLTLQQKCDKTEATIVDEDSEATTQQYSGMIAKYGNKSVVKGLRDNSHDLVKSGEIL
ncbi:hypothetical protein Patl1_30981 [Pistacia atlantica]|uniref:Uncharacterized protein n=1 Tax=Pistacia atlantica TaxID=434234 RepID=A0ACC1ABR0_9ROSI|nr:hypothetical protein Patl1_30981 [Pistacia atlantica]